MPSTLGSVSKAALDNGDDSAENVEKFERRNIEPYIAGGSPCHNQSLEERLAELSSAPPKVTAVEAMNYRLKTPEGKTFYASLQSTVEPVFGIIKTVIGFRQFMLRGFEAVKGEWRLQCIAYNLKRLCALNA